jgi:hypothetical protein
MKSNTSRYYASHPEARKKRNKQQAKINARPEQIAYRSELNKANRKAGTYGKMKKIGKDRSHTKSGGLVLENTKTNRSRNGANGLSTKK